MLPVPANMISAQDFLGLEPVDSGSALPGDDASPQSAFLNVMRAVLARRAPARPEPVSAGDAATDAPDGPAGKENADVDEDTFRRGLPDRALTPAGVVVPVAPEAPADRTTAAAGEPMEPATFPGGVTGNPAAVAMTSGDAGPAPDPRMESADQNSGAAVTGKPGPPRPRGTAGLPAELPSNPAAEAPVELLSVVRDAPGDVPVLPVDRLAAAEPALFAMPASTARPADPTVTPPRNAAVPDASIRVEAPVAATVTPGTADVVPADVPAAAHALEPPPLPIEGETPPGLRTPDARESAGPSADPSAPGGRAEDVSGEPDARVAVRTSRGAAPARRDAGPMGAARENPSPAAGAHIGLQVSSRVRVAENAGPSAPVVPPNEALEASAEKRPIRRSHEVAPPEAEAVAGERRDSRVVQSPPPRPADSGVVRDTPPDGLSSPSKQTHVEPPPARPLESPPLIFSPADAMLAPAVEVESGAHSAAPVARPETLGPALGSEAVRILERLGGKGGEFSAEIQLHPRELGRVRIEMSVSDHRMELHLTVENREVRHLVQAHASDLRHAMEDRGYTLSDVNVLVAHDGGDSSRFGTFSERPDGRAHGGNPSPEESTTASAAQFLTDTRVNVLA